jgi:hypothetical protein
MDCYWSGRLGELGADVGSHVRTRFVENAGLILYRTPRYRLLRGHLAGRQPAIG